MNDWKIHRREGRCSACAQEFQEGQPFYSLLFFAGDALAREDRCEACFQAPAEGGDVLYWRTHHQVDRRARFAVDFEAIEELFLALEGRTEGRLCELRYLMALLLLRKKRLKLVGVRRHPTGESMCLRRPRRVEEFEVAVFELDAERAQALKAELARVFEGAGVEGLLAPGPETLAPGAVEAHAGGSPVAEATAPDPTR